MINTSNIVRIQLDKLLNNNKYNKNKLQNKWYKKEITFCFILINDNKNK